MPKATRGGKKKPVLRCPWCGERADVFIDSGAGAHQSYVEDCAVCCRPCVVTAEPDPDDPAADPIVRLDRE